MEKLLVSAMLKVKNRPTLRKLAKKIIKANKNRNRIAMVAIVLTTLLFTSIFSLASAMKDSFELDGFKQNGSYAHAAFKNVNEEQITSLGSDDRIKEFGIRQFFGIASGPAFEKMLGEVSATDVVSAKQMFSSPQVGRLPKEETKEIACDTKVLEALGVEAKLGEKVTLTYDIGEAYGENLATDDFVLSGYWDYDPGIKVRQIFLPHSYVEERIQQADYPLHNKTGSKEIGFCLQKERNLENQVRIIMSDHGYQNQDKNQNNYLDYGINGAYLSQQVRGILDLEILIGLAFFSFLILLTGYLIIYNIFQISIQRDIKMYGLLKTIGMTKQQLRRVVYRQAWTLSLSGIPLGIGLGYAAAYLLSDRFLAMTTVQSHAFHINLWAIIFSALFALGTIWLSCSRPAHLAGVVSPIEALHYADCGKSKVKGKRNYVKQNTFSLAWRNAKRNPKRLILVGLSVALSLFLLQFGLSMTKSFNEKAYLERYVAGDFLIAKNDYFNMSFPHDPAANQVEPSYFSFMEDYGLENKSLLYTHYGATKNLPKTGEEDQENPLINLYELDTYALSKLTFVQGSVEDVLANPQGIIEIVSEEELDRLDPELGQDIQLQLYKKILRKDRESGVSLGPNDENRKGDIYLEQKEPIEQTYHIVARATMKWPMSLRSYFLGGQYVLPEGRSGIGRDNQISYAYLLDIQNEAAAENELKTKLDTQLTDYHYESVASAATEFKKMKTTFVTLCLALTSVLMLIGVLNLMNAVVTALQERKREFAILRAIGMTKRQLNRMAVFEAFIYVCLGIVIASFLNGLTARYFYPKINQLLFFVSISEGCGGMILAGGLYLLIAFVIVGVFLRKLEEDSITDRIRDLNG